MHRRTATRVRDGRVQKKNNWSADRGDYHAWSQSEIRLDRRDPAPGSRHLITIAQLREMVELLPDWDEVAVGLDAIVLDGDDDCMGWHRDGVVAICAWEAELWWDEAVPAWLDEHAAVLDRLGVEVRGLEVRWTEPQARAFQLLHILPHELGHHHDRITTRSRASAARGEPYAEAYALRVLDASFDAYAARFGI
jgi:hypothetical protein